MYFVRHAHSNYSSDELGRPLSEKGFADASRIKELLKDQDIDYVISSPYKRAIQTVEGIAQFINQDVQIINGFKERKLSEGSVKDFSYAISKVWENQDYSLEGGESNRIAQQRGIEATFHVLDNYQDKNIVIGTHGNLMVLIMNYFDKQFDFEFWKRLEMPDIYKMTFEGRKLVNVTRLWKGKGYSN